MSGYLLDDAASADLQAIAGYIAQDNASAARRWAEKLFAQFELLAANPGLGHRRADLTRLPLLFWPVHAYVVVYRRRADSVQIVAVLHGARDVPRVLRQRAGRSGKQFGDAQ